MSKAVSALVAQYCESVGYRYHQNWLNPPLNGVLFRSRTHIRLRDVMDARSAQFPFILGRASGRGRRRREIAVLALQLPRPVPNMLLKRASGSLLPGLGIALKEHQRLSLEGNFDSHFSLYCPRDYERDALYIFTPDVMAQMIDSAGVLDAEFIDDRLLLYARVHSFFDPSNLGHASDVVSQLQSMISRQTRRYDDIERAGSLARDPFKNDQLSSASGFAVGKRGRRIQTRTTALQKAGIVLAIALSGLAAGYWFWMVARAFYGG